MAFSKFMKLDIIFFIHALLAMLSLFITDHTVAQALQLSPGRQRAFQNVNLGTDMVDYVLGDPLSTKGMRTLQAIKRHDFVSSYKNLKQLNTPIKLLKIFHLF